MSPLKSSDILVKIGEAVYYEIEELDGVFDRKLPKGLHVMGRILLLKRYARKTKISN